MEDNPDDIALTLQAFKKNNIIHKVFVAHDGAEALHFRFCRNTFAARDPRDRPQLTLLEINLPRINGTEVLRWLRADGRTHQLPIVIFSSSNEERDLIDAYKSGANSYVRKPVGFDHFEESIRQLCTYWLQLNEVSPN